MTKTDLDGLIDNYLRRLDAALGPLPTARRQQLLTEITEHLHEARSALPDQTEAAVRDLLDRVGQPEDIAAEALADQSDPRRRWSTRRLAVGLIGLAVLLGLGAALALNFIGGGPSSTKTYNPSATTVTGVDVPNVIGMSTVQAGNELRASGMAVTTAEQPSTAVPTNVVISQAPAAGSRVARGSVVTLTVSSGPPSSTATSTIPNIGSTPVPNGIYVDGSQGTPHYFISLTNTTGGGLSGSVDFLYQDGQTSVVFTFEGTTQNAVATLHPTNIPQNGGSASQNPATVPSAISATLGPASISLGECTSYLHFTQSLAQCGFAYSSQGVR
ncbi:MAG: PASTA domain-containing protein [Acidimicrobiales bacterium]